MKHIGAKAIDDVQQPFQAPYLAADRSDEPRRDAAALEQFRSFQSFRQYGEANLEAFAGDPGKNVKEAKRATGSNQMITHEEHSKRAPRRVFAVHCVLWAKILQIRQDGVAVDVA
jgi:hypothetical protein